MNDKDYLNQKAIHYADCQVTQEVEPLMHSMLKAAVSFGWDLAMDRVYKTKFNPKQDLESYIGGNYPEDML